ncbi:MAG: PadR family transcriptional regulator [Sciscionella sp.]|nr:PadR family transcriptional regulator [Sciscionella sp.]
MSAIRILVLGVVRSHGQTHGYQVRRDLVSWSADKWANIKPGSIYHALKQLTKEKLLEQVETEPGAGPERTIYRLTEDGETELIMLVSRGLSDVTRDYELFNAAFVFCPILPRAQVIGLLRARLAQLGGQGAHARSMTADGGLPKPEHVNTLFLLWQRVGETQADWVRDVIEMLEAGKFALCDDERHSFGQPPENEDGSKPKQRRAAKAKRSNGTSAQP